MRDPVAKVRETLELDWRTSRFTRMRPWSALLAGTTPLPDQAPRTAASTGVSSWEGTIGLAGVARDRRVTGRGYLEMTGYAGSMGRVLGARRNERASRGFSGMYVPPNPFRG